MTTFSHVLKNLFFLFFFLPFPLMSEQPPNVFDATIPVLDMHDFYEPQTRQKFISDMTTALKEVGFFAVINTGVDKKILDEAYITAEKFFRLSKEEKLTLHHPENNGQRGYVPGESAKGQKGGDFKEFYHVGRSLTPEQKMRLGYWENVWPSQVNLQDPLYALYEALEKYTIPLEEAMAEAIGQPESYFTDMTKEGDILFRAIHYPSNPPEDTFWAAEHTDIDLYTILPRATAEGL